MPDEEVKRQHTYFAEAIALEGSLRLPFVQQFSSPTSVKLNQEGGYVSQHTENFRLGGVVSFRSAYTQVAGNRDIKADHGWNTLATAVIEDLNVMDVLTADRVVVQISTDHPLSGYVQAVTFLGSRFENLRIAGHPVKLDFDPNILGPKPAGDQPYTSDSGFLDRATRQYERLHGHQNLPAGILKRYNQVPSKSANLESIECSLVNQAEGSYPGRSFGHLIDVPNFGWISLATLSIKQSDPNKLTGVPMKTLISLNMLEIEMGCIGGGTLLGGSGKTNGQSDP
ncbi:MAG TPA: hypothetical protein VGI45_16415 [Terracidiphilus sp.]|jgi:hypothetical protein